MHRLEAKKKEKDSISETHSKGGILQKEKYLQ
jgi:hypothetical protein